MHTINFGVNATATMNKKKKERKCEMRDSDEAALSGAP